MHSVNGGTGSGIGSLLAQEMQDEYPGRILKSYTVMPLSQPYNGMIEPYNAVLSIYHLIKHLDEVVCMDSNSVCSVQYQRTTKFPHSYEVVNRLIAFCMSGITSCLRYAEQKSYIQEQNEKA